MTRTYDGVGLSNGRECIIEYTSARGQRTIQTRKGTWQKLPEGATPGQRKEYGLPSNNFYKQAAFDSKADPMADAFGPGLKSNPEEIKAFREECKNVGVKIIEREHEALSYQSSPTIGKPGQLTISPNASYGAWAHEMQHMRDDMWRFLDVTKTISKFKFLSVCPRLISI